MEYEFHTYEEMEAELSELFENQPELSVNITRVMDGGRLWLAVQN